MRGARWAAVVAAVALGGLAAPATAHAVTTCHAIDATGTGVAAADGSTTAAMIRGGGLLTGRTAGAFTATGDPPVLSIAGTVVFTPNYGKGSTLSTEVTGTFDLASGAFRAVTGAVSGTGRLASATASLTLEGVQLPDLTFTETVRGWLCVDRAS